VISASQAVEGVVSEPLVATFVINAPAEPAAPATPATPVAPAEPAAPAAVVPAGRPAGPDQLASTGAGSLLPVAGLAAASLLLGALFLALGRRKPTAAQRQA
jgi:hypothetical protein